MFDAAILPLQQRVLRKPAEILAGRGISADSITICAFCVGLLAVPAVALELYPLAILALAFNRLGDGLDGAVARLGQPAQRGAFLDIALDFVFYAAFPLGFALAEPENALPAAVLIASFVGTGSSFLAFSVIAAENDLKSSAYPSKGIYYLGGLTEGFETIAIFTAMCLFPQYFEQFAYGFALACCLTTLSRWHQGWKAFGPSSKNETQTKQK
jgi:phosphatidylglycerophosphate synthase